MDINDLPDLYNLVQSDDNIELVRKLLIGGADPNFEYSNGETLIHRAAESTEDNVEIVQELIKAGSDVDRSDNSRYKPLHYAVIYRKRRVVEALLKCRIDINSKDFGGKTALHYAVSVFHPRNSYFFNTSHFLIPDVWIVKKLLDHKDTNVDERDSNLETSLMLAVGVYLETRIRHIEIVNLLLNHGSKVNAFNKTGQTPLHIALTHEYPCPYILVLLLLNRSSLFKMNNEQKTPLDIIGEHEVFHISSVCLKIIVFHYDIRENLIKSRLKDYKLLQTLRIYYDELKRMKSDFIANKLTVFDFFGKRAFQSELSNPISAIYKPMVERLITGHYPQYFCYILHRISKPNLSDVLKCAVDEKYCIKNKMEEKNCGDDNCKKEHHTAFSEVFRIGLMSGYLERLSIFCLIVAFSTRKIDESYLNVSHHECYLTDSWEEYPDDYF